jgi:FkbM family methyltransferase
MPFLDHIKKQLDRESLRFALVPLLSQLARRRGKGVKRIFYQGGVWIHETDEGYLAYHQPFVRLNMLKFENLAAANFFWGYRPKPGDVIIDVGAGVGEEAITFSKAIGETGKLVCVEAHPRTYHCLEKLVEYNRLANVTAIHAAITEPARRLVTIEDSSDYLRNRLDTMAGIPVPTTTVDGIHQQLGLGRVQFLKMNIEGAEALAIRGMLETLKQTEVLCISCHDFLAERGGGQHLRTKAPVRQFLQENGLRVVERLQAELPPYLTDQLWAYNDRAINRPSETSDHSDVK